VRHKTPIAALFLFLMSAPTPSQQQQLQARPKDTFTGRILQETPKGELYLDIGPCGGRIAVFHRPYLKSPKPLRSARCGTREVDIYSVTQN
jgi:hypothetical protein